MKVEPNILVGMLKSSILRKTTRNPTIDPVAINFDEDAVKIYQLDNTNVLLILHKYNPSLFKEYKAFGLRKVSNDALDYFLDSFKSDAEVSLDFTNDTLIVEGARERLKYKLSTADAKIYDKEVKETDVGLLPPKLADSITASYLIDINEIASPVLLNGDEIIFTYNEKELIASVSSSSGSTTYDKKVGFIKNKVKSSGKVSLTTDMARRLIDVLNGQVWITFTSEPMVFSQIDKQRNLTFIVATKAVV